MLKSNNTKRSTTKKFPKVHKSIKNTSRKIKKGSYSTQSRLSLSPSISNSNTHSPLKSHSNIHQQSTTHFSTKSPASIKPLKSILSTPSFQHPTSLSTPTIQSIKSNINCQLPTFSQFRRFSTTDESNDTVDVTYIEPSGDVVPLRIKKSEHQDDSLMTLAVKNQVDMEGSCDGQLACSTCHCILSQEDYDHFVKLIPPTDEELDMLDTAFGLTPTSRLGCQIPISKLGKNITLTLPKFTR